jgi:hypothetical protein
MKYSVGWVKQRFDAGEAMKYVFFWGHTTKKGEAAGNYILSQWYSSPFSVEGIEYKTAEHWMMAKKAMLFRDYEIAERIVHAVKPAEVKELGRQIKHFDERVWSAAKGAIVTTGNYHKFGQHKALQDYLLNTGDLILVEASPVDSIWGIGLAADASRVDNPHVWRGLNLLGFALMEVRDQLRNELRIS